MTSTQPTARTLAALADADRLPSVQRILNVWRSASKEQRADGATWYGEAHSLALALDPTNPLRAAGVISAFSPMTPWKRNQELAIRLYAEGVATGNTGSACGKAQAIFDGADVVKTLRAAKTVNFALTIADPADSHAVVVDRHAVSIAIGRCSTDEDTNVLSLKGVYDLYADAYREAARLVGVAPSVMQAVTWVVWRETKIRTAAATRREAGRE